MDSVSQVQELHKKMTEETRRADNLAFEMRKLEEKHETVVKEKEVWKHLRCQKQELCFFLLDVNIHLFPSFRGSSWRENL